MDRSDLWLSEAAARGDVRAFSEIVRRHQSAVTGFLVRMTRGDHATADDLAQDAFIAAYRKIGQFRGECSLRGWLLRVAYSRFLQDRRRAKLELAEDDAATSVSPDAEMGSAAKLDLERAIAKLSGEERAALTLHFALGCYHEETASILGDPFLAEIAPYISQMDTLQRSMFLNQVRDLAMGRRRSA